MVLEWNTTFNGLWQTGQRIALAMLRGAEHEQDREDIVATAIAQTVTAYLEKIPHSCNAAPSLSDLEGMMKTIVRRRLLDHHRQQFRRKVLPLEESISLGLADTTCPPDADAQAADLWRTIAELDPPLPDLFTDRFLHGWTTIEIARRRDLNPNTVLSHFHRGFARLRERLGDYQPTKHQSSD